MDLAGGGLPAPDPPSTRRAGGLTGGPSRRVAGAEPELAERSAGGLTGGPRDFGPMVGWIGLRSPPESAAAEVYVPAAGAPPHAEPTTDDDGALGTPPRPATAEDRRALRGLGPHAGPAEDEAGRGRTAQTPTVRRALPEASRRPEEAGAPPATSAAGNTLQ